MSYAVDSDATIVTWGAMVHVALKAAELLSTDGKEIEVVDLRTLAPFDSETCVNSVNRTGRHWSCKRGTVYRRIGTHSQQSYSGAMLLESRGAPVVVGALDTPVPFAPTLEDHTIPTAELVVNILRNLCD